MDSTNKKLCKKVQQEVNTQVVALIECDKMYLGFMESRLRIQDEHEEFLRRLICFQSQFSVYISSSSYKHFRLFNLECEAISSKVYALEKKLDIYDAKCSEIFRRLKTRNVLRSEVIRKLRQLDDINFLTVGLSFTNGPSENEETKKLEEDWANLSEYADREIVACHSLFHVLCKEFCE